MHLNGYLNCTTQIARSYCKPDLGFNARFTLICPTYTNDPVTGEVIVNPAETQVVLMRLNHRPAPDSEITQGSDRDRYYMDGYLVSPLRLNFDLGDKLEGQFRYENTWINCAFYQIGKLAHNLTENAQLHEHTGQRICGYLKLEGVS